MCEPSQGIYDSGRLVSIRLALNGLEHRAKPAVSVPPGEATLKQVLNCCPLISGIGKLLIIASLFSLSTVIPIYAQQNKPALITPNQAGAEKPDSSQAQCQISCVAQSSQRFESIRYADQFAAQDICEGINMAYADLPSSGGKIVVPFGSYRCATSVSLATIGKVASLDCTGATITWAADTGDLVTLDYGSNGQQGHGIFNCTLLKSGLNRARGIVLGGASVAQGAVLSSLKVDGFSTDLAIVTPATFNITIQNVILGHSSSACLQIYPNAGGAGIENIRYIGGLISACSGTGIEVASQTDVYLIGVSIDDNGVGISGIGAQVRCVMCHFENANQGGVTYISIDQGLLSLDNSTMADDVVTGENSVPWIKATKNSRVLMPGVNIFSLGRTTTVPIVALDSTSMLRASAIIANPLKFTGASALYPNANAGNVLDSSTYGLDYSSNVQMNSLKIVGKTPSTKFGEMGFGRTTGIGNGALGAPLQTTLKGTGSGPNSPSVVTNYLQVSVDGRTYWIPLMK